MKVDNRSQCWPPDGLETLGACPICGCQQRQKLYGGLTDDAFACAPGRWDLHLCADCHNGYLDPRPSIGTIGLAYSSYYTHASIAGRDRYDALGLFRKIRRIASNGYTNARYGTDFKPSSVILGRALGCFSPLRRGLDLVFRWLPKPHAGQRLLDVGCGNGDFLATATTAGWEAYGADPDPVAISKAYLKAADARVGGIEAFSELEDSFHAITFSHSIEHVHDPREVIRAASNLLVDGGVMYVDTPNIASRGRHLFGRHWRGLEVPRHLVLFTAEGLEKLLREEGFEVMYRLRRTSVIAGMFSSSELLAKGCSPYEQPSRFLKIKSRILALWSLMLPLARLEFVTLIVRRGHR